MRVIIHAANPPPLLSQIQQEHGDVEFAGCDSYADLPRLITSFRPDAIYSIRFAGTPAFPHAAIKSAAADPDHPLRWLSVGGVGIDHLQGFDPRKLTVTNAAGVAADMMADYVISGFLHFLLDVPGLQADQATRTWRARTVTPLTAKSLLILGLGNTGQAIAKRAKAFAMPVMGVRANPKPTVNVDQVGGLDDLPDMWPKADLIAVCLPLLPATRGLINHTAFSAMRPGVIIADVSRGGIIDQAALLANLQRGVVAGAAIDVFEREPLPADDPLWLAPNLLISPHCSSVYSGWESRSLAMYSANLARFKDGEILQQQVDPSSGY